MPRSLVISANYAARKLVLPEAFLRSLQATGCDADVLLIANHGSVADKKQLDQLMPGARIWIPIPKLRYRILRRLASTFPTAARRLAQRLSSAWRERPDRRLAIEYAASHLLNITCSRYLLARRFLLTTDTEYVHALLADSRDVIFQDNPFNELPTGLTTGLESLLVRDQRTNTQWLEHLYEDDKSFPMEQVRNQKIICSGVTLGDTKSIIEYLELVTAEIMSKLPRMIHEPYLDQGIHIGLLRTSKLTNVHLQPNGEPWIATVGTSDLDEFRLDEGVLKTHQGLPVRIVHQYDRHPDLTAALGKFDHAPNR